MHWQVHWLEAEGDLTPWRPAIASEIAAARSAVAQVVPPPRLDILVQRLAGAVIPEIGLVGHAYRRSLFALTVDPDNPHFAAGLTDGTLQRQVTHEAHHCLRMGGVGYGRTLGEALVSEGLAGQFTRRLFGNAPEPWERAVDDAVLRAHVPDAAALGAAGYDHSAWFFGTGALPRWLGYTLGYAMVGSWLGRVGDVNGSTWVNVRADTVLSGVADLWLREGGH